MRKQILTFSKDFGAPEPLSEEAKHAVLQVLDSGRLFRYQGTSIVSDAEVAFAEFVGTKYALGVNSGGCALFLALKTAGCGQEEEGLYNRDTQDILLSQRLEKEPRPRASSCAAIDDGYDALSTDSTIEGSSEKRASLQGQDNSRQLTPVLTNGWTLSPVPGAISHAGGRPILVDCDKATCQLSIDDLYRKQELTGARILLLSYMRGRVPSMQRILKFCEEKNVRLIEDCAHTLGTSILCQDGTIRNLGTFGHTAAFSLQTNKLLNAGEGGFLVTNCEHALAKATILSGSYGHFALHKSRPDSLRLYQDAYEYTPNCSMRMTTIAGALVNAQLHGLNAKVEIFNRHWDILFQKLSKSHYFYVSPRSQEEAVFVGSSFQFQLEDASMERCARFSEELNARRVAHAWYGREGWVGFVSTYKDWKYISRNENRDASVATSASATISPDMGPEDREHELLDEVSDGKSQLPPVGVGGQLDLLLDSLFDIPLYHSSTWPDSDFEFLADLILSAARESVGL